jgi:non-canonical (house-cleaning) NTP pyrophosphatase
MPGDLREFWSRHQEGVDVAAASSSSGVLLGIRDGFQRFLATSFERVLPVAIVAQPPEELSSGLPLSDHETLALARDRAAALESGLGGEYHFYIGAEGGLQRLELAGEPIYFVHYWAALRGLGDETWGSSGSLQVPRHLVTGLEAEDMIAALPATRRRGGMLAGLSQGRETRRSAVAQAVFHALTTRFFGVLGSRLTPR